LNNYEVLELELPIPLLWSLGTYRQQLLAASAHAFPYLALHKAVAQPVTIDPKSHLLLLYGAVSGYLPPDGKKTALTDFHRTLAQAMGLPILEEPV
jgi:hypothetical protein